jgi:hypothetical protein
MVVQLNERLCGMFKIILSVLVVIVAIILFIASPFATIWSINTLFSLNIAFTLETWLAAAWISAIFGAITYSTRK